MSNNNRLEFYYSWKIEEELFVGSFWIFKTIPNTHLRSCQNNLSVCGAAEFSAKELARRNAAIDMQLEKDRVVLKKTLKILLLGNIIRDIVFSLIEGHSQMPRLSMTLVRPIHEVFL